VSLFRTAANEPGFLVTIDGPNGSGKTFLTEALEKELQRTGASVHSTCQPSPTELGRYVRDAEAGVRGRALACLVAADRHSQCETEIEERLRGGEIVLCDRYVESSLVLQRLDGVKTEFIVAVNSGIPRPDLRLRLLATPERLRQRLASRQADKGRRFERSGGPECELELYAEADELLTEEHDLPATVYDTTQTEAEELGARAARLVVETRSKWRASSES
jgi:dTMP kinase